MKKGLPGKAKRAIREKPHLGPEKLAAELGLDAGDVREYMQNAGLIGAGRVEAPPNRFLQFTEKYAFYIAMALAAAYAAYLILVTLNKYYTFAYNDFDMSIYSQFLANTLRGNIAHTPICTETVLQYHQCFGLFLLLPIFALFPYTATLLVIQAIAIAAVAVPLYFLAAKALSRNWAVLFVLAYVLYPAKTYLNLFEFHEGAITLPLIMAAFYFWYVRKPVWFSIFAVLAMITREDVPLVIIMFSVMSYFRAKMERERAFSIGNKFWVIAPAVAGLVYFFFATQIVAKSFREGFYVYNNIYPDWGKSLAEVVWNVATNPLKAIEYMMNDLKARTLFAMLIPTAFLAVLSPITFLAAIPIIAANFLSSRGSTAVIYYQYVAHPTAIIFAASVLGLKRLLSWTPGDGAKKFYAVLLVSCAVIASLAYGPVLWPGAMLNGSDEVPHLSPGIGERVAVYEKFLGKVPDDVKITASFRFLPRLATHEEVESFHYEFTHWDDIVNRSYTMPEHTDYALVDMQDTKSFLNFWGKYALCWTDAVTRDFGIHEQGGPWGVVDYMDDVVLLKKGHTGGPMMVERCAPGAFSNANKCDLRYIGSGNNTLKLVGARLAVDTREDMRFLSAEFAAYVYFPENQKEFSPFRYFLIQPRITALDGTEVRKWNLRALGTYFYPTQVWTPGELVIDRMRLYLPPAIPAGKYRLEAAIITRDEKGIYCIPPDNVDKKNLAVSYGKDGRAEAVYATVGYFEIK
jgi:uncharacterized membrane protein